ncbi:MAG: RluA family pseudouridine synthase [Bacteroidales bacterium]|nr:RluA family pseudouridine synthase [Bacteroidales bacterium]
MDVLFEDNHLIAVNKSSSHLVQGDKTGDISLDICLKEYLKKKYGKPGKVFVGVTHRIDRPVSGVVLFAKTSKALSRMNRMFRDEQVKKIYWAVVKNKPPKETDKLIHFLVRNEKQNKSFCHLSPVKNSRKAILTYHVIGKSDHFYLLEIDLETGRHHQIRAQLAHIGCPVRGDLKYNYPRSNKGRGISLHARCIEFMHPVKKEPVRITAPVPTDDPLWKYFDRKPSPLNC